MEKVIETKETTMGKIIVEISKVLIESGFKTGNMIDRAVIQRGLPSDAVLIGCSMNHRDNVDLVFESAKETEEEIRKDIIVTTLHDA
jgi:hypothetical protein